MLNEDFFNSVNFKNSDLRYYDIAEVYFKNTNSKKTERLQFNIEDHKFSKKNLFSDVDILPKFLIKKGNAYNIKKGNYFIDSKIVLPKRHGLTIDPGVNIDFARDSYIYVEDGFIEINGLKDDNVSYLQK